MQIWNSRNCVWCSSLIGQQMSHYGIRRSKCEHCLCREGMNAKILHMSLPTLRSKPEVHLLLCCAQTGLLLFPQESPCIQTTQPCWVQSPSAWHLKERRLFLKLFSCRTKKIETVQMKHSGSLSCQSSEIWPHHGRRPGVNHLAWGIFHGVLKKFNKSCKEESLVFIS